MGTAGPDTLTYTPTGAAAGTVALTGGGTLVNFTAAGAFTIDGGGGSDTLVVNGTAAANTITASGTAVQVDLLETVNYLNIAALTVNGLQGSDTFNVTPSPTVSIFVDGGDPIGVLPGDQINVVGGGSPVEFFPGPLADEGGFQVGAELPISFVHIETGSLINSTPLTISGTNGNDAITIIADSTDPGTDGVQDFTVSVNNSPAFLFLNTPAIQINALSGDDTITVRTPRRTARPGTSRWASTAVPRPWATRSSLKRRLVRRRSLTRRRALVAACSTSPASRRSSP